MSISAEKKTGGVSFVLRARNEEKYIGDALQSLACLTIPFEIIVILHLCDDRTYDIVEKFHKFMPIHIHQSKQALSRPGFETLVTPEEDPHSLASFYNDCFKKANYKWMFKWDADFRSSEKLIDFLHDDLDLECMKPTVYNLPCHLDPKTVNTEPYLFNCLVKYKKHVFWELPVFPKEAAIKTLPCPILSIPPNVIKSYWKQEPWFCQGQDATLEQKWKLLIQIVGMSEPMAAARASSGKDFQLTWDAIHKHKQALLDNDIHFFQ